jgi:hypothetical protein
LAEEARLAAIAAAKAEVERQRLAAAAERARLVEVARLAKSERLRLAAAAAADAEAERQRKKAEDAHLWAWGPVISERFGFTVRAVEHHAGTNAGARVVEVVPGGVADMRGLLEGDVLVEVAFRRIMSQAPGKFIFFRACCFWRSRMPLGFTPLLHLKHLPCM